MTQVTVWPSREEGKVLPVTQLNSCERDNRTVDMVVQNENVPLRFKCLNTWSPVGGTVWRGYGTIRKCSLLEEVLPGGRALSNYSPAPLPVCLLPVCKQRCPELASSSCNLAVTFPPLWITLWNHKPK